MICINCGKKIDDEAKFCPSCGSKNEINSGNLTDNGSKTGNEVPVNTSPNNGNAQYSIIPQQINNDYEQQSSGANIPSQVSNSQQSPQVAQPSYTQEQSSVQTNTSARYIQPQRGNEYNQNPISSVNYNNAPKPKSGNKRLKTAFFVLLGVSGLLVIGIFAALIFRVDSSPDIKPILEDKPKVEYEVKANWDKGEYSINNIGAESNEAFDVSAFVGVWKMQGYKANLEDSEFAEIINDESVDTFIVIDENNNVHYITVGYGNSILSHEEIPYEIEDNSLITSEAIGMTDGSIIEYKLINDRLGECVMLDGMQLTEWAIYELTDKTVDEMINNTAAIQETERIDEPTESQTAANIEEYIEGTAWISTGNEYIDESSTNEREYDLEYGDIVYIIENGIISHETLSSEYLIDPTGEIMYAYHREEELGDGSVHSLHSAFFIENGYLYEIEFIDDVLVSNIIEYEIYEP